MLSDKVIYFPSEASGGLSSVSIRGLRESLLPAQEAGLLLDVEIFLGVSFLSL